MTTIYLIRHAEAEGNLYRRIHGWYDSLVTDNGYQQIEALKDRFRNIRIDAVWSSDLFRSTTTARAISLPKNLSLHTDPSLRELRMGVWEDKTWGEARQFQPREMELFNTTNPDWKVERSESFEHVGERMEAGTRRLAAQYPGQTIALFSHGMAIRQLIGRINGVPPEEWQYIPHGDNTSVSQLSWDGLRLRTQLELDNSHLSEDISTLSRQAWWRKTGKMADVNLWFRPIDWEKEKDLYLDARREALLALHGKTFPFDREGFLREAEGFLAQTPWGVTMAFAGDSLAGLVTLDPGCCQESKAGYVPFGYIVPERRGQSLGVQLIGQAVAFYRPMGRDKLRLRCATYNHRAQQFYKNQGFTKAGSMVEGDIPLDIWEKYIGYGQGWRAW